VLGRLDRSFAATPSETVDIAFDLRFLHFFDLETGAGIYD
jgi:hypothetical protein